VYVGSFIICAGQGLELTSQFVNSDTNKTAAVVIRVVECVVGRGHAMDCFYNSLDLACFLKSEETDYVGILHFS
jgi:hypothetical protein